MKQAVLLFNFSFLLFNISHTLTVIKEYRFDGKMVRLVVLRNLADTVYKKIASDPLSYTDNTIPLNLIITIREGLFKELLHHDFLLKFNT
jgi:hypothetical protein